MIHGQQVTDHEPVYLGENFPESDGDKCFEDTVYASRASKSISLCSNRGENQSVLLLDIVPLG